MFHHHGKHHKDDQVVVEQTTTTATTANTGAVGTGANVIRQENAAVLGSEKIHHRETVHKQDVITRDIEKTEVVQVQQPIHETQVNAVQHHEKILPTANFERNYDKGVAPQQVAQARLEVDKQTEVVEHAPVVQERVHKKIIEDIQPVVHRDVIQEHHVAVQQPIHEHIVEAPVVVQRVAAVIESGSSGLAPTRVGTDSYQVTDIQSTGGRITSAPLGSAGTTQMNTGAPLGTGALASGSPSGGLPHNSAALHQKFQGETMQDARLMEQNTIGQAK